MNAVSLSKEISKLHSNAPLIVWKHFEKFCEIPRPSKGEARIREYVIEQAKKNHCSFFEDKIGNILVRVPASKGLEDKTIVLIQNHLDMVNDARPGIVKDYHKDSVIPFVDGEWVRAEDTTLGSDNGIGACLAISLMDHQAEFQHPELELLFTIDEETGLTGALQIDVQKLGVKAKIMLNIDTEEWGSLYIGCAGGKETRLRGNYKSEVALENIIQIKVGGLVGGHSGVDIHRQRGNAHLLMLDLLKKLESQQEFRIISWEGGKAHNIIPREAQCVISVSEKNYEKWESVTKEWREDFLKILPLEDQKHFFCSLEVVDKNTVSEEQKKSSLSFNEWKDRLSPLLTLFPHGVLKQVLKANKDQTESEPQALVRLSNNLAKLTLKNGNLEILSSLRFMQMEEGAVYSKLFSQLSQIFHLEIVEKVGYPSWAPDFSSPLLKEVSQIYNALYGAEPDHKAIHAGLECGIIAAKIPGLRAISFGPTIVDAHSPDERVNIKTVEYSWEFLKKILSSLK